MTSSTSTQTQKDGPTLSPLNHFTNYLILGDIKHTTKQTKTDGDDKNTGHRRKIFSYAREQNQNQVKNNKPKWHTLRCFVWKGFH